MTQPPPVGYDAPVVNAQSDHLNRWSFAREIYTSLVECPADWSVRIGIFGEWGSGKTSVLRFVEAMASQHDHVIVWFNPWRCTEKPGLWRSFVLDVISAIESKVGGIATAGDVRTKLKVSRAVSAFCKILKLWEKDVGEASEDGVDLLRKFLEPTRKELQAVRKQLKDRRIIILVDDLDRTSEELVPEILFALKELMDLPGFSFLTAFDPTVVGQVLGRHHPGFGDGLRFLEKIIDYPRWLPAPDPCGLGKLALTESKTYCPFVPLDALQSSVSLLPQNPRAVRQFVRLLSMMKAQISRHNAQELHWPTILGANIMKVRFPNLANALLRDENFWVEWSRAALGLELKSRVETDTREQLLNTHVEAACKRENIQLNDYQKRDVCMAVRHLCEGSGLEVLLHPGRFSYQLHIAEAPTPVTWKEFETFLPTWRKLQESRNVTKWIEQHASSTAFSAGAVRRKLLARSIERYASSLQDSEKVLCQAQGEDLVKSAKDLLNLIENLLFDEDSGGQNPNLEKQELDLLFEAFARIAQRHNGNHEELIKRNEELLCKLVQVWSGGCTPLIHTLKPHHPQAQGHFDGQVGRQLHEKLCSLLWPKFAKEVLQTIKTSVVLNRLDNDEPSDFAMRTLVLNPEGALWKGLRKEALAMLAGARENVEIQSNAYSLLQFFDEELREKASDGKSVPRDAFLLSDEEVAKALLLAATSTRLNQSSIGRISHVAGYIAAQKTVALPVWWDEAVAKLKQRD